MFEKDKSYLTWYHLTSRDGLSRFSGSDSTPVLKFSNPEIIQIWETKSCLDSGYRQSNRNLPMFLLNK